jgi:hypothetical protein
MENNEKVILDFLKDSGIVDKTEESLEELYIKRDKLINIEAYENLDNSIIKLKDTFSTSSITSLQDSAKQRQKWPLLNLIRQLLKINGFILKPFRKSAGYTASGKKKYERYFHIEKKENNNKNELNN